MVRWKVSKRYTRRRVYQEIYQHSEDESFRDNETDSEEDDRKPEESSSYKPRPDGEHEGNYRNPMIRMAYFSLMIVVVVFHPGILVLAFLIEMFVYYKNRNYYTREQEKKANGLLSPSMTTILQNRVKFKEKMSRVSNKNPGVLSYEVLRSGSASFRQAAAQEVSKCLNKVGHFCLNILAFTDFAVALMVTISPNGDKLSPEIMFVFYTAAMWMQLATIRYRSIIPLVLSVLIEIAAYTWVTVAGVKFITRVHENVNDASIIGVKDYFFFFFFSTVTIVRLVFAVVLFRLLKFKTPHFSFANTVFLKPINTPVTFSSIMAPQELDPTNPYYPQTVYNNNNKPAKNHLLDRSLV
ncbi:hypothetical protein L3Y34_018408 [Caenorhabditis briggsae]|uniref:Uncharacterized protein n=2 Tax=Caenorhabditis briggsae TaxID=6238 RepID=A0AAE9IUL1_CAEBR|nr:hypothetical protein L3Y34_018408 [Caenorhabditis briggsae]